MQWFRQLDKKFFGWRLVCFQSFHLFSIIINKRILHRDQLLLLNWSLLLISPKLLNNGICCLFGTLLGLVFDLLGGQVVMFDEVFHCRILDFNWVSQQFLVKPCNVKEGCAVEFCCWCLDSDEHIYAVDI